MTQNAIFPFRLHSHSVFVLLFTFTRQEEWVLNGNRWQQFTRLYFTSQWQLLCIMWEKSAFEYWAKRRNSMRKSMPTFLSYFWFHIFGFRLSAGVSKSIVILQKKNTLNATEKWTEIENSKIRIEWFFCCTAEFLGSDRILFSLSLCQFLSPFHLFSLIFSFCARTFAFNDDTFAKRMHSQEWHQRLLCKYFAAKT